MKRITLALFLAMISVTPCFGPIKASENTSLISADSGNNYNRLNNLLSQQKWREANDETLTLLLSAGKRSDQGWLTPQSIQQVPCGDLQTMDELWREYSNNRFGFSIQLGVFVATGNRPGKLTDEEAYSKFGDDVGWRKDGDWISFKGALDYSLNAPKGHLPNPRNEYEVTGSRLQFTTLTQRLVECKIGNAPQTPTTPTPEPIPDVIPQNIPPGEKINLSQKSF